MKNYNILTFLICPPIPCWSDGWAGSYMIQRVPTTCQIFKLILKASESHEFIEHLHKKARNQFPIIYSVAEKSDGFIIIYEAGNI